MLLLLFWVCCNEANQRPSAVGNLPLMNNYQDELRKAGTNMSVMTIKHLDWPGFALLSMRSERLLLQELETVWLTCWSHKNTKAKRNSSDHVITGHSSLILRSGTFPNAEYFIKTRWFQHELKISWDDSWLGTVKQIRNK